MGALPIASTRYKLKHVKAKYQRDMRVFTTSSNEGIILEEVHTRDNIDNWPGPGVGTDGVTVVVDRWIVVERQDELVVTSFMDGSGGMLPKWLIMG